MRPRWTDLNDRERTTFQAVFAFLLSRLTDRQSLDWALRLNHGERAKRIAVLELVDRESRRIAEPWRSAWRLIEESWISGSVDEHDTSSSHIAKKRLQEGDRSGALVNFISDLVAPRLKLGVHVGSAKRPRTIHDLLSIRLTSGTYIDPRALGVEELAESDFLTSLAQALEGALALGLERAHRTGWDGNGLPWQLGSLYRVYHVSGGAGDPDKYHRGIAPCVKLLHEVVTRLAAVQSSLAREFPERWMTQTSPVHLRLWAALARDATLVDADNVAQVLLSLDDERFWSLHFYPEVAELRARRFSDLDSRTQASLAARIRKLPSRRLWRGKIPRNDLDHTRLGRAIEELRRIRSGGGGLPQREQDWLDSNRDAVPEVPDIIGLDYGFTQGTRARWVGTNPERVYDALSGDARLQALESALSSAERRWEDDPSQRAFDWLREHNNSFTIVADLESLTDSGAAYPSVWEYLGRTHSPPREQASSDRNAADEAKRVLALIARLPDATARKSVGGIAHWLMEWRSHFTSAQAALWLRLWPIAVEDTNAREGDDDRRRSRAVHQQGEAHESRVEMAALNTSAGQLVGVFLSARPDIDRGDHPFDSDADLRAMRDAILGATGRARLVALHRLIEHLAYFLLADRDWAETNLVETLNANDPQAIALWHAIGRETRFHEVLKPIGAAMALRASDPQLSRDTRQSLTFSLVIECLHASNEGRDPAVPYHIVQQALRSVEDDVRVHAAQAAQRFIVEVASAESGAEELFRKALVPFLQEVWPQERSLVTPGISAAFARVPGSVANIFSAAVSAIERFLIPFACWGMYEYGLDAEKENESPLAQIDNPQKAASMLRLLDLTIGTSDSSVVPNDLSQALEHIQSVAPRLARDRVYRRLLTAARRA